MENKNNLDFSLYKYIKANVSGPVYLTSGKEETNMRCPFCGDSSNPHHAHLYFKNSGAFNFYCQKCEYSGIGVTLLKQLNVTDTKITQIAQEKMRTAVSPITKNKLGFPVNKYDYSVDNPYGRMEKIRLKYLNYRFGRNFSVYDAMQLKYILNLPEFFKKNHINFKKLGKMEQKLILQMNGAYSIFMLSDNSTLVGRYMGTKEGAKRYIKVQLVSTGDNSESFYHISHDIDLTASSYNVYITEGIYDLIGVYNLNLSRGYGLNNNDIYVANNGKGFRKSVKFIKSLGVLNGNINIYADSDVGIQDFRKYLGNDPLVKYMGVNIIYNKHEGNKDFGVPLDEIIPSDPIHLNLE